jgi:hypothetical protein
MVQSLARAESRAGNANGLSALNAGTLKNVLLVRIVAAGEAGATRAVLRRDITPLVEHRLSAAEWRRELDALLLALVEEGLAREARVRIAATASGTAAARRFLGAEVPKNADWLQVRDVLLVAHALGLETDKGGKEKRLTSAQGLRGAILQQAFGIVAKGVPSAARLRDALARKQAGRKSARSRNGGKSADNRRAAERLLRRPREFDNDGALVAELAAEQVGAMQTGAPSLRLALLRRLLSRAEIRRKADGEARKPAAPARKPAAPASADTTARGPDLGQFSREVSALAGQCAEGWAGNRRAFISHVWARLVERRPNWGLSEADYKNRLVEAHKSGHLTLAYADLRDKANIGAVEASAIRYRNTEWHFIRVED